MQACFAWFHVSLRGTVKVVTKGFRFRDQAEGFSQLTKAGARSLLEYGETLFTTFPRAAAETSPKHSSLLRTVLNLKSALTPSTPDGTFPDLSAARLGQHVDLPGSDRRMRLLDHCQPGPRVGRLGVPMRQPRKT